MPKPYPENMHEFCVTFTKSVIAWNAAEHAARRILIAVSGKGHVGAVAAITHLGSQGLDNALLTFADAWNDPGSPTLQKVAVYVTHFVDGLGTMRGYRNFYVHSLVAMGPNDQDDFEGFLFTTEARGRLAWIEQKITIVELEQFMDDCHKLRDFGRELADYLSAVNGTTTPPMPLSSIQRPTWPEKVKKPRSYLTKR
jgi:hypothetical protein